MKNETSILRTIRFSPNEFEKLKSHATSKNVNISRYIKDALKASYSEEPTPVYDDCQKKIVLRNLLEIQNKIAKANVSEDFRSYIRERTVIIWDTLN